MNPLRPVLLAVVLLPLGLIPPARAADAPAAAPVTADSRDVSPAQPVIPDRSFNLVKDYSALGDGVTDNTAIIKQAIAAVKAAGGGTLVVPAGTYLTGPFDLCSSLNLHLEAGATILFSGKQSDYGKSPLFRPLLSTSDAHDVLISGLGTLDGHGDAWWPSARKFRDDANARGNNRSNTSPRPRLIAFRNCRRVRMEDVTLQNSPVMVVVPALCQDVTFSDVKIHNPEGETAPNTDGIDPSNCRRVLITHCRIDTGDDCIAVNASSRAAGISDDILIEGCTFLHGHGCSIGSGTSGGIRHLTVRNCTFDGTDTGVRLKSYRGKGGLTEDCLYTDLTMRNVGQAISIASIYAGTTTDAAAAPAKAAPLTPDTPHWRNITIRRLTATGCTLGAGLLQGLPEQAAENLTLDHVTIDAPVGLHLFDVNGVTLHDVRITAAKGPALITDASVRGLVIDGGAH